jgi:hypothetical protein
MDDMDCGVAGDTGQQQADAAGVQGTRIQKHTNVDLFSDGWPASAQQAHLHHVSAPRAIGCRHY